MVFQQLLLSRPCCQNPALLTTTDICRPLRIPNLHLRKRLSCWSRRSSKIFAFFGLTTPPYKLDALEPYMSREALEMHWGVHHRNYVDSLNKQLENNDPIYGYTMEEMVKFTYNSGNPLPEFNNVAEVWNHDFFWESMQPEGGKTPSGGVLQQIEKDFGSFEKFREEFVEAALTFFGSGWVWLVCEFSRKYVFEVGENLHLKKVFQSQLPPNFMLNLQGHTKLSVKTQEKRLAVVKTSNAVNPLCVGDIPIINLDMWEHAYYHDYKDNRVKYVNIFMNHLVSWNAATGRMARAESFVNLGEPRIPVV